MSSPIPAQECSYRHWTDGGGEGENWFLTSHGLCGRCNDDAVEALLDLTQTGSMS